MADEAPTIQLDVTDIPEAPQDPIAAVETPAEQPAAEASSTEETKDDTVADTEGEEPPAGQDTEGEAAAEEAGDPADETDTEQFKKAEERKAQLNTEIRDLVSKRNEIRAEITKANNESYKPATAEELQEQGMSPEMAEATALKQRAELAEYNAHVADLNANLNTEALQVLHDFPMFDEKSPQFNEDIAQLAKEVYSKVSGIRTDPKTNLAFQVNAMPYTVYQALAKAFEAGTQRGQVTGQAAADKMMAAADTPTNSAPVEEPKADPFMLGLTSGLKR